MISVLFNHNILNICLEYTNVFIIIYVFFFTEINTSNELNIKIIKLYNLKSKATILLANC